jgi:DNA (cytosine-5)-methyltransferase 1
MKWAYYNENDPKAAAWLRELIKAGLIADGEVDERSIVDVSPDDLRGFVQCHFFAGIGGWSYALRLAGWPDERAVWTGSCPCQPWSVAGKGSGADDTRDLWPAWFRLIEVCRPATVFGEQVASEDAVLWLDRVAEAIESIDYAIGAGVLPAVSVGAPHRRDRLYFVADAGGADAARRYPTARREPRSQEMGRPWAYANWQCGSDSISCVDDGLSPSVAKRIVGGYGNAIVPQVAAEVIAAYMDICWAREGAG